MYSYLHGLVVNRPCRLKRASVKIWASAEATYSDCPLKTKACGPDRERPLQGKSWPAGSVAHGSHAHGSHAHGPLPEAAPSWWSTTGAFASGSKEQERSSLQRMRNLPSTPLWQEHWACVHTPAHLCTTESGHHLQSPRGRGPPPVCLAGLKVYTRL